MNAPIKQTPRMTFFGMTVAEWLAILTISGFVIAGLKYPRSEAAAQVEIHDGSAYAHPPLASRIAVLETKMTNIELWMKTEYPQSVEKIITEIRKR